MHADFIYSEYLSSVGSSFRAMVWQIAEDYAKADLLLRLPGYSPMPAFREVRDTALVVRRARKDRTQVKPLSLFPSLSPLLCMNPPSLYLSHSVCVRACMLACVQCVCVCVCPSACVRLLTCLYMSLTCLLLSRSLYCLTICPSHVYL